MTEAQQASCQGKHKYPNWRTAKKAHRPGLDIYRCRFCQFWHLGNGVK